MWPVLQNLVIVVYLFIVGIGVQGLCHVGGLWSSSSFCWRMCERCEECGMYPRYMGIGMGGFYLVHCLAFFWEPDAVTFSQDWILNHGARVAEPCSLMCFFVQIGVR